MELIEIKDLKIKDIAVNKENKRIRIFRRTKDDKDFIYLIHITRSIYNKLLKQVEKLDNKIKKWKQ